MTTYSHDPNAVLDYGVDWRALTNGTGGTDWLEEGETITASTWTLPDGITVDPANPALDDATESTTTIWLTGGTAGQTYRVTNHITTSAGREDDRSIFLRVIDR